MSKFFKICVVTGSRADYGLLRPVMEKITSSAVLQLQIIATGSHLATQFGMTYREIESDGFVLDKKIKILSKSDSSAGVAKSMAICLTGMVKAFKELEPDLILVLGDRSEIFAAAQASMLCNVPLAHIGGGDNACGTYDNIIRHCISKIAALHFVTHGDAGRRILQMGENPDHIYCVGSTCVDNIKSAPLFSRMELQNILKIRFSKYIYVVTFHPLTMGISGGEMELHNLLKELSLKLKCGNITLIFTKANADNGGRAVNLVLEHFVKSRENVYLFDSLGSKAYLSLVSVASLVIGNSSSGIYEAPYLGTPTVDIGKRQLLRKAPISVFRCDGSIEQIRNSIADAEKFLFQNVPMVYGDGNASSRIVKALERSCGLEGLSEKIFFDANHASLYKESF